MASFTESGVVWEVKLSHNEAQDAAGAVAAIGGIGQANPATAAAGAIIAGIGGIVWLVDEIGGKSGVNVVGVLETQLVTVVPAGFSPVGILSSFADALAHATGLPGGVIGGGLGAGIAALAVGPAGVVIGGVAGFLGATLFSGGGNHSNPGDVLDDRRAVGPWEKFMLVSLTQDTVAVSSWQGYFSAENNGGDQVHANRHAIGPWEQHKIVHNANGTVSLLHNGWYMTAENGGGGGSFGNWNRRAIGEWEQFWMEFQPDGTFALKTHLQGTYVSVQGGS